MESTIVAAGVAKTYPSGAGLRGLDLTVDRGSIFGLIGPSGSGKTTTVRVLNGLLRRDTGDLAVLGVDPDRFDAGTKGRIGYLAQDTTLYPRLSVRENLDFAAALHGLRGRRRAAACEEVLEFVELADNGRQRLEHLSGGMKRRVGLAAALVHEPDVLFLDEPTAGLDPILRVRVWERLEQLREDGRTMVVTTQQVAEAAYCDIIAMLSEGEVARMGSPERLRQDAFGGELVDVVFAHPASASDVEEIGRRIGAEGTFVLGPSSVRYAVPDAGSAIPVVSEAAASLGVDVDETERYVPEFDEVFVRLVDEHRAEIERR